MSGGAGPACWRDGRSTARIVPFERDGFTEASFPMLYAEATTRRLDTVQIDIAHGSVFLDEEERLASYRRVLDDVERAALSPAASRDLMHRIAQQL
ncbi:Scr1 family TA system antitoxin-like transcriptional regulator [Streptomyces sp. URMC 124]|uniref:Scr1 family TA system antitoxin-like transcriptional regulator n=1 Tax=Streptomyces sp. URMC 124 TaxID=3423405 RepID=UPI003F1CEB6D